MGKVLSITLFMILFYTPGNAQISGDEVAEMKNWQIKGMARSALRISDYHQRALLLEEWYRREPSNQQVGIQLGETYIEIREYQKAKIIFSDLYRSDPRRNLQAQFYYAMLMKMFGKYEEALEHFEVLRLRARRIPGNKITRTRIEHEIIGCEMGIAAGDSLVTTEIEYLGKNVNSHPTQIGPILLNDHEFIFGTTLEQTPEIINLQEPYTPIIQYRKSEYNGEEWLVHKETEPPFLNSDDYDTGRGAFSPDRQRFYSAQCFINDLGDHICHLYVSHLHNGVWSDPEKLDDGVNHPRYTTTQPAVGTTFDAGLEVLYFISDRPGGAGGMDIWFSVYNKRTREYQKAQNAGVFINTPQDEITPYYDVLSHRLYFSSNGWPGFGGFDIFYSTGSMVTWNEPVNIGLPVNSPWDDMDYVKNWSGRFGIFVSNRPVNKMSNDYNFRNNLFSFHETETPRILVTGRLIAEDIYDQILHSEAYETIPDPQIETLSNKTGTIEMLGTTSSVYLHEFSTNTDGEFEIWLDPGMDYKISIHDSTLLDSNFLISTKKVDDIKMIDFNTISLSSSPQKAIVLNNIYYEFDEAELTSSAKSILDTTLLVFLNKYPDIMIEISAHTDNIGDKEYNQQLSEQRAANVVAYLVSRGISSNRLTSRGYGDTRPVAPNQMPDGTDHPEGRQKNRRTEFRITGQLNK